MNSVSFYAKQGLLIVICAFVTLQGIDAQRFISFEKELVEMAEEVYDPLEISISESKKTNFPKIKRPFNGFLYHKTAAAGLVQNTFTYSASLYHPKLHLRNRVFLI